MKFSEVFEAKHTIFTIDLYGYNKPSHFIYKKSEVSEQKAQSLWRSFQNLSGYSHPSFEHFLEQHKISFLKI